MNLPSFPDLRARAADSLTHAPSHRRLVLLHAGLAALLSLLVSGINFAMDSGIQNTGGLQGVGLRSILTTVQTLLTLAMTVLLPFWDLGYTRCAMTLARKAHTPDSTLLYGFRRFRPALRLLLLSYLLYALLGVACIYAGTTVLSFTPLANPVYELFLQAGGDPTALDPQQLTTAMLPLLLGGGAVFAVVAIPLSYRLRLSAYYMLDGSGARQSLLQSARSMKGNCLALLRLDLGFWWYYAAQALLTVIGYGDLLLPHLGIQMNSTVAYFLFYVLSLAAQLGLFWWKQNSVSVTYAHAYLSLLPGKENGQLTMDN